ncbi:MAG: hypothetical protein J6B93_06320 [Clostridia bacterium]|nr:hypothetical protein [Clostridia bacterium]
MLNITGTYHYLTTCNTADTARKSRIYYNIAALTCQKGCRSGGIYHTNTAKQSMNGYFSAFLFEGKTMTFTGIKILTLSAEAVYHIAQRRIFILIGNNDADL